MKYRIRIPKKMDLEVTWIHHWKKNGKSSTLTRPFRARAVQGLSGLALLNVDPKRRSGKNCYSGGYRVVELSNADMDPRKV